MLASANVLDDSAYPELQVVLTAELARFWDESGYEPSTAYEERAAPRLRVRAEGLIEFTRLPPAMARQGTIRSETRGKVLVNDISRSGIGILFHQQIFPGEEFEVRFGGHSIQAKAVRCKKYGLACFRTGAILLSSSAKS